MGKLVPPVHGGKACPRLKKRKSACNTRSCPIDCRQARWSKWTKCTKTCKGGTQRRSRRTTRIPVNGGKKCGAGNQKRKCNSNRNCRINCKVSGWQRWGRCSKKCGGGRKSRTRRILVSPRYGGRKCPTRKSVTACNTKGCPRNCMMKRWGEWSKCTKKCGGGRQTRRRSVRVSPRYGGRKCGRLSTTRICNRRNCPTNCKMSGWRGWGRCSKKCNTRRCPISCLVTGWRGWTRCNRSCGRGIRYRTRSIRRQNRYGGSRGQCNTLRQNQSCQIRTCHRHHRHHSHNPHRHRPHGHRPHGHRPHRHWWGRRRLLEADTETQKE